MNTLEDRPLWAEAAYMLAPKEAEKIVKLCPSCGKEMKMILLPSFGRLLQCGGCEVSMAGAALFQWRDQNEGDDEPVDIRETQDQRYRSHKPCPECGKPMWALTEVGYGTRHQCEECRLTVMFGGAIARWRGPRRVDLTDPTKV